MEGGELQILLFNRRHVRPFDRIPPVAQCPTDVGHERHGEQDGSPDGEIGQNPSPQTIQESASGPQISPVFNHFLLLLVGVASNYYFIIFCHFVNEKQHTASVRCGVLNMQRTTIYFLCASAFCDGLVDIYQVPDLGL